jgi:hypothetical protein
VKHSDPISFTTDAFCNTLSRRNSSCINYLFIVDLPWLFIPVRVSQVPECRREKGGEKKASGRLRRFEGRQAIQHVLFDGICFA